MSDMNELKLFSITSYTRAHLEVIPEIGVNTFISFIVRALA
jgi:hypothetical protein